MKKFIMGAMLSLSLSVYAQEPYRYGDWFLVKGEDPKETFFTAGTESDNSDIGFTIIYSEVVECEPVIRFLVFGEPKGEREEGIGQIGEEGLYVRVDEEETRHFEKGYYRYTDELTMIDIKPSQELMSQIFSGNKFRIKVGDVYDRFSLSGSEKTNAAASALCQKGAGLKQDKDFFQPKTSADAKWF